MRQPSGVCSADEPHGRVTAPAQPCREQRHARLRPRRRAAPDSTADAVAPMNASGRSNVVTAAAMSSRAPVWCAVANRHGEVGLGPEIVEHSADHLADGLGGHRVLGEGGGERHAFRMPAAAG